MKQLKIGVVLIFLAVAGGMAMAQDVLDRTYTFPGGAQMQYPSSWSLDAEDANIAFLDSEQSTISLIPPQALDSLGFDTTDPAVLLAAIFDLVYGDEPGLKFDPTALVTTEVDGRMMVFYEFFTEFGERAQLFAVQFADGRFGVVEVFSDDPSSPNFDTALRVAASFDLPTEIGAAAVTEPTPAPPARGAIGVIFTDDDEIGMLGVHKSGEFFGVLTDRDERGTITAMNGVVWVSPQGDTAMVEVDEVGLPSRMAIEDFVFAFDNYTESTVDVTVFLPDGTTESVSAVEIGPAFVTRIQTLNALQTQAGYAPPGQPGYAKRGLDKWRFSNILARSGSFVGHSAQTVLSAGACATMGWAAVTTGGWAIPIIYAGIGGAACAVTINNVRATGSSAVALWNSVFDPEANFTPDTIEEENDSLISDGQAIGTDIAVRLAQRATTGDTVDSILLTIATEEADILARRIEADMRQETQLEAERLLVGSRWNHTYGTMVFESLERAEYSEQRGGRLLEFSLSGNVLTGIWVQDSPSGRRCESERDGSPYWGHFRFEFGGAPGEPFSGWFGTWSFCAVEAPALGTPNASQWNGARVE